MADTEANYEVWNESWPWSRQGDEWSDWWGDTPAQWFGALLPRIHAFVPTSTILEIAPGYGRWTQYLKDLCEHLVLVDLSDRCIEHCRERFGRGPNIEYHVNDGRSLDAVADGSVDFAFSFDSLVHAEQDVIDAYLAELARKLKPDGVGFVHHSTVGDYGFLNVLSRRLPERLRRPLAQRGVAIDVYAWRAESGTADRFARKCEEVRLACISQEKVNWTSGPYLTDSISLVTPRGSQWERPLRTLRNRLFRREARRTATLYSRGSFPGVGHEET
jgi:SAM-dependent methyltransferase